MDSKDKFEMFPLPLEKEFQILTVREKLHELKRVELEQFLIEALTIMTKLAYQVNQLKDYVELSEGKNL